MRYGLTKEHSNSRLLSTTGGAWALFLGMGLLMLGNGLQGSLLGIRASHEGFGTAVTGLIMSGFFAGFLLGSVWTPGAVQKVGHIRVFAALAALASGTILIHALLIVPSVWWGMRFVSGVCFSGIFVIAESWLNDRTENDIRGQILALYMITMFLGMGSGQLMLNLADPGRADLFIIASVVISLAVVPLLLSASPAPEIIQPRSTSLKRLLKASPLGVVGTFSAGLTNGSVFGMGAVFAHARGFSIGEVSAFMGLIIAGAAVTQWPIGKLSDIMDRRLIITAVTFIAATIAILAGLPGLWSNANLLVFAAVFGGLALPIHSLCLAYTNDYLDADERLGASSGLVLVLGSGSIVGPLASGVAMSLMGPGGFFWWLAFIHLGLGFYAVWRMTRRPSLAAADQSPFVATPQQSSLVVTAAAEQIYSEHEASVLRRGNEPNE